jgi:hypothetical protein
MLKKGQNSKKTAFVAVLFGKKKKYAYFCSQIARCVLIHTSAYPISTKHYN